MKKKLFSFQSVLLIGILFLGLFLRLFRLDQAPSRLTVDEMSFGYNAFSILKTGNDEWGRTLPLIFEAFGDFKQPLYVYATVPFIFLFGLNDVSVRLPSVIAGTMLIVLSYFLVKEKMGMRTALITSFLIAVSPWAVHLSRMGFESNLALTLFVGGLLSLQQSLKTSKKKWTVISGILFGLTFYTYIAYRLIVILFFIGVATYFYLQKQNRKFFLPLLIFFVIVISPLTSQLLGSGGTARFSQVSIFFDKGIEAKVIEQQNYCFLTFRTVLPKICRVFFNKYTFITSQFTQNYFSFFSPHFLFWEGDEVEYLNPPGYGEFILLFLPFYVVGLWYFFSRSDGQSRLWQWILLIAPIPSALVAGPQIVRGSLVMFFLTVIIGLGLVKISESFNKKLLRNFPIILIAILSLLGTFQYFTHYHAVYAQQYETAFSPFPNELLEVIQQEEKNYTTLYFSDSFFSDAHMFVAFYQQIDPAWYQQNVVRPQPDSFGFSHPVQLGKYEFGNKNIDSFVCDINSTKVLYFTNDQEFKIEDSKVVIKDFAEVHPQVKAVDIDDYREKLTSEKSLELLCSSNTQN